MREGKISFRKVLAVLALALMAVQIVTGMVWMVNNIKAIPVFGDSSEYLNLSQTLELDEYRPILYPLTLRIVQKWASLTSTAYQVWLYLAQTVISFGAVFFGVAALDTAVYKKMHHRRRRIWQVYFSLYILTIPMMTFMNFSVLTDSLATSMLILFLACMVLMFSYEKLPVKYFVLMAVSLLAECLLRADRLYSCLFLTILVFVIRLVKAAGSRKRTVVAMLCICLLVPGIAKTVNTFTQTPGLHGRIETNLDFILLDRVVWPNMRANYKSFPKEIRKIVSKKEAKEFDRHNNNVMYQMAPLVEERVGAENAGKVYREMAVIVFRNQPGKVLGDIGEDILAMTFTPISSFLNTKGMCKKGDSWNIHCMSTVTKQLTKGYNSYYQYTFLIMLVLGFLAMVSAKIKQSITGLKTLLRVILPYIGMGIIFTLWFCIGDGAPPNDRYALIIYVCWAFVEAGMMGSYCLDIQGKKQIDRRESPVNRKL